MRIIKLGILLVCSMLLAGTAMAQTPVPPPTPVPLSTPPRIFAPILQAPDDPLIYVRAYYSNDEQFQHLADYVDLNETEVNPDAKYVLLEINTSQLKDLEALGVRVEIDKELNEEGRIFNSSAAPFSIPRYACYRTVEETFAGAERIAAQYPDLAEWIDIGDSWQKARGQGGYDLRVLKLTRRATPAPKPALFIMSGLHAREYVTVETALRIAEYLAANYGIDPDVTWLLDTQEIHFLLQSNPDGRKKAEAGLSWRKNTDNAFCSNTNSRGVDLNRNFSFRYGTCQGGSCGSANTCSIMYRGSSAGSEPEVQAIQNYLRSIFADARAPALDAPAPANTPGMMIDLHSFGLLVMWPFSSDPKPANNTAFLALGDRLSYYNGHNPRQGSGLYLHDGVSSDFGYGVLGVASFTFELGYRFFQDCATFERNIYPGNLKALLYAAKVTRAPYLLPSGPEMVNLAVMPATAARGANVQLAAQADDARFKKGLLPAQSIAAARYSIDVPPWQAGAALLPMSAGDGAFYATRENVTVAINTSNLSAGRHTAFVQGMDSAGNWGPASTIFFTMQPTGE